MSLFAVIGNPIAHSRSPLLHNSSFKILNLHHCYTRYLLDSGADFREKFISLGLAGANITVPYKEDAFAQCDIVDSFAEKIGAVNTVVAKDGLLYGHNTDAPGFLESISCFEDINSVLILGAGGTAKAVCVALKNAGKEITVLNRSDGRLDFFRSLGVCSCTPNNFEQKKFDLVVNTTSAGLNSSELPFDYNLLKIALSNSKAAFEVLYGKSTPFLQLCDELGIKHKDGKDMLIYQAFFALEYFLGEKLDKKRVVENMRRVVD